VRRYRPGAMLLLLVILLAGGCGQKTDLYLPEDPDGKEDTS